MADKTAEQKLANLKIAMLEDILRLRSELVSNLNVKSVNILNLLQSSRTDSQTDNPRKVKIEMSMEDYEKVYLFFKEAQERDLVGDDAPEYIKKKSQEIYIKQTLLDAT